MTRTKQGEEWKAVIGAPDWYVSTHGRLRHGSETKKGHKTNSGYIRVKLGKYRHDYLHRFVAEAFCANPLGLRDVDHIDGDKLNNRADNLRWISHRENVARSYEKGKHPGQGVKRPVIFVKDGVETRFESLSEAERKTGVWHASINYSIMYGSKCNGGRWKDADLDRCRQNA